MSEPSVNEYAPDSVSPPGETLRETLEALDMSQAELAERTGRPHKTINGIIHGKTAITTETAIQLERVLGVPASFWNSRESAYREHLARVEEERQLQRQIEWLQRFPVNAMVKLGWIRGHSEKTDQLRELLRFFGVAGPEQWEEIWMRETRAAFRRSAAFESDPAAVAAWLRKGEIEGQKVDCASYDEQAFKDALLDARELTREPVSLFQHELRRICANAGVAVVFTPQLPKSRVSGATQWLSPDKALVQLSLRYKSDDHFWFSFFHEAAHIVRHGKRDVFIDDSDGHPDGINRQEEEANRFAAAALIPQREYKEFVKQRHPNYSKAAIEQFAADIGVAPGIVVGRLQHDELLPFSHCNDLKRKLEWAESTD